MGFKPIRYLQNLQNPDVCMNQDYADLLRQKVERCYQNWQDALAELTRQTTLLKEVQAQVKEASQKANTAREAHNEALVNYALFLRQQR